MGTFKLTRREVSGNILGIFSSDRAYNYPGTFANRKKSREALEDHFDSENVKIGVVSGFLGTGKTMLVDMVKNTFKLAEGDLLPVRRVTVPQLKRQYSIYNRLIIDDVDIRTGWRRLKHGLEVVRSFVEENPCPVVLLGDMVTRNEELLSIFSSFDVVEIPFEPLDRQFFLETMNLRLRFAYDADAEAVPDGANVLFDDFLLNCFTPETVTTAANFREILTIAREMALSLEPNEEIFRLGEKDVISYCRKNPLGLELESQVIFLRLWLSRYVHERYPYGKGLEPFSVDDVVEELSGVKGLDAEVLEEEVLMPLASGGVLQAMGTPFQSDECFVRYPGPYLPTAKFLLHVYFGGILE